MRSLKSREIFIEYERVQSITRRARTQVVHCTECREDVDFVAITEAAGLFNTEIETLTRFAAEHQCHFQMDSAGRVFICIGSLLAKMRQGADGKRLLVEPRKGAQR